MTTYTFTVHNGATMLQLNKQSLDQCIARLGAIRNAYPNDLQRIVLTLRDGETITVEQETTRDQT